MTVAESCALLVHTVRQLSAARDEAAAYRVIAQQAMHLLHDQHVELQRTKQSYHALLDEARALRRSAA